MATGDTIFALSSGHGRAGVAVIRVSGPNAGIVIDRMASPRPKPRFAAFRTITDPGSGEVLDQALVLWFPAPKSETGEDMAELQVHGGRAVVAGVFEAIGGIEGCRLAEPGEFARRAFENGKLDLTGVEGLADLIDAETAAQRRQALRQADGALARLYGGWRADLIEALALLEAAIDFSDEGDVARDAEAMSRERFAALRDAIARHLDDGHRGELVRDGFQVVLAGAPNSGKSSLLNALARRDVAIVSEEAGTTRDIIEVKLDLEGLPVVVSDTAGIREAAGKVEQEGIRRALQRAGQADLVVWLVDASNAQGGDSVGMPDMGGDKLVVLEQGRSGRCRSDPGGARGDHGVGGDRAGYRRAHRAAGRHGPCPRRVRRGAGPDAGTAPPPSRAGAGIAPCRACSAGRRHRARCGRPAARGGRARSRDRRSRRRGRARRGVWPLLHRQMRRATPPLFHVKQ